MRKSFSGALAFSAAAGLAIAALVSFGMSATASDADHGAQSAQTLSSGSAAAASTPSPTPTPTSTSSPIEGQPQLTERETWLVFQDLVRQCMNDQGFDYLYFEWWNPIYQTDDHSNAAMPKDMTPDESAAWSLALDGNSGLGADYRWQDAGCWGAIVEQQGNGN